MLPNLQHIRKITFTSLDKGRKFPIFISSALRGFVIGLSGVPASLKYIRFRRSEFECEDWYYKAFDDQQEWIVTPPPEIFDKETGLDFVLSNSFGLQTARAKCDAVGLAAYDWQP